MLSGSQPGSEETDESTDNAPDQEEDQRNYYANNSSIAGCRAGSVLNAGIVGNIVCDEATGVHDETGERTCQEAQPALYDDLASNESGNT